MQMPARIVFFTALFFILSFSACTTGNKGVIDGGGGYTAPRKYDPVDEKQLLKAFQLSVGDVIQIKVYGESNLKGTYQIYPDCNIYFPMVKSIKVCGRTPEAIRTEIAAKLHKDYFQRVPSVVVQIKEFNSKKISVFGEVTKPGRFKFTPGLTVIQAIAMAGGFSSKAAKNDTRLMRTIKGVKKIFRIRLGSLGKRKIQDLYLRPGDVLYVPESWI